MNKHIEIGTLLSPVTIYYPTRHYDDGKLSRCIKVVVNDETATMLRALGDDTIVNEENIARLKVWQNAKVTYANDNIKYDVDCLLTNDKVVLIGMKYQWVYEGKTGVSVTCHKIHILSRE